MSPVQNFSLGFYFHTLTKMLWEPRQFFSQLSCEIESKRTIGFLIVSSLFFTGASLASTMPPNPIFLGSVFFINAVGMAVIASGIGYIVMIMIMGRRVTFSRFFSIYALSSGVTLLASWVPFFICLTEPWKWWLIGAGMIKSCGFRLNQALLIIAVSICTMVLLFRSVFHII